MRLMWWYMPIISALKRLRKEDLEFKDSWGDIVDIVRPCPKKTKTEKQERIHECRFMNVFSLIQIVLTMTKFLVRYKLTFIE
jgi:hypothetical protein